MRSDFSAADLPGGQPPFCPKLPFCDRQRHAVNCISSIQTQYYPKTEPGTALP